MSENQREFEQGRPNPYELMRTWHPDLFSDTDVNEVLVLPRAVFEYHLETLTSRKQEYEFEHFCRKLAEKEICPNLCVQTGPTGGGDGKVDTETYPVADQIAERWWAGLTSAGEERWAFAFSAKKDWKPKLKADVDNILSTGRDYKQIFFFTNQFVSAKERASQEDKLSGHAGIPVRIFDRAWIVEKVYEGGHLEFAVAALGITDIQSRELTHSGPIDTARLAELEELDRQIKDPSRYQGARYQLVEDCLRSAILARGLERAQNEVESRFEQANRLAKGLGYRQQLLRIAYNRAWTAFWWYEDYLSFNKFYGEVEKHLGDIHQISEVELLFNLWQLLLPSVSAGNMKPDDAEVELRRRRLLKVLEVLAEDPARPNQALQAKSYLILMKITQAYQDGQIDKLDDCWLEMSQVIDETPILIAFPLERLVNIVSMIGRSIESSTFDVLYEKMVEAIQKRRSDGAAGIAFTERGLQKLQQRNPYEAIKWFGRAEELLVKDEYRDELVKALIASSHAYQSVALLWAARNKALAAVERSLSVFIEEGKVLGSSLIASKMLVWLELQLGRIPQVLSGLELANILVSHLNLSEGRQKTYKEELQIQEATLGLHFLNLPFESLQDVTRLPDVLERFGFLNARMALLFALGQVRVLYDEGYIPESESSSEVQSFFELWQDQPVAEEISLRPLLATGPSSLFRSRILGLEIIIETPNSLCSFCLAESILGGLEAFLATSGAHQVIPYLEQLEIVILETALSKGLPQLRIPDHGCRFEIEHGSTMEFTTSTECQEYIEWLRQSIIRIMSRILIIKDVAEWLEEIAGQERGYFRAVGFGDVLTISKNVFGLTPRLCLENWLEPEDKEWKVLRKEQWREPRLKRELLSENRTDDGFKCGVGPLPEVLINKAQLKHSDQKILSPIDIPLWDRAEWGGTVMALVPPNELVLGFCFRDQEAGQLIFRGWLDRWGSEDKDDALRLAVIRGLSNRKPSEYAITVGPNLSMIAPPKRIALVTVSRINRMTPASTANLDRFLEDFEKVGSFLLVPAYVGKEGPKLGLNFALRKRHLHVRQAWQICENDPDIAVLRDDDDPIIPVDVVDPPIEKAIAWRRAIRQLPQS